MNISRKKLAKKVDRANVRAAKYGVTDRLGMADIDYMLSKCDGTCPYCGRKLVDPHLDHIVPLNRGGANTRHNIQLTCPDCNRMKSDMLEEEFFRQITRIFLTKN